MRPYFPFLMGNGIDSVLIDYSGSMSCDSGHLHTEQHQNAVCAWYKTYHRTNKEVLSPIIKSNYTLYANGGEAYEVGHYQQTFNPDTAILTTHIEAHEFEIELTTFMLDEHVLVEYYNILKCPANTPEIALNINATWVGWNNHGLEYNYEREFSFSENPTSNSIDFTYKVGKLSGNGFLYTDAGNVEFDKWWQGNRIVLKNIHQGMSFTKYLAVVDELDIQNGSATIDELFQCISQGTYAAIKQQHEKRWLEYSSKSNITLPDKWMEYVYKLSLYLIKSNQNPKYGFITTGNYPQLWGGGISCGSDEYFSSIALLGANRISEMSKMINGYNSAMPTAKDYASQINAKGAYYPWFMNYEGKSTDFETADQNPGIKKLNVSCITMSIYSIYQYTRDIGLLEKSWEIIEQTLAFLISKIVAEYDDYALIQEMQGADESIDRINDTAQLISLIKCLEAIIEGAEVLGKDIDPLYARLLPKLKNGLQMNYKDNILQSYLGGNLLTSLIFTHYIYSLPDGISNESIEQGLEVCKSDWGLSNPGTYRNLVWPWNDCLAAWALSYMKDSRSYERLANAVKYTSEIGAFCEKIRPDRFWIGFNYVTCHGSYVSAVNAFLCHTRHDKLRILPCIPSDWENLEIDNLRVQGGLCIKLKLQDRIITELILINDTKMHINYTLEIPPDLLDDLNRNRAGMHVKIPAGSKMQVI